MSIIYNQTRRPSVVSWIENIARIWLAYNYIWRFRYWFVGSVLSEVRSQLSMTSSWYDHPERLKEAQIWNSVIRERLEKTEAEIFAKAIRTTAFYLTDRTRAIHCSRCCTQNLVIIDHNCLAIEFDFCRNRSHIIKYVILMPIDESVLEWTWRIYFSWFAYDLPSTAATISWHNTNMLIGPAITLGRLKRSFNQFIDNTHRSNTWCYL